MADIVKGFRYFVQGGKFLWRTSGLKRYAFYPWLINTVVIAGIILIFAYFFESIFGRATGFLPDMSPDAWWKWVFYAIFIALKYIIGALIVITFIVIVYYTFFMLGMVIAAPFNDVLSQKTEEKFRGSEWKEMPTGIRGVARDTARAITDELRKLIFFLVVEALLLLLNLLPFLGSAVYVVLATGFGMIFFGLEFTDQSMGRRRFTFKEKRRVVWEARWLMLGFGGSLFVIFFVPFLNLLCIPVGVVGGTLLYIDLEDSGRVAAILGHDRGQSTVA